MRGNDRLELHIRPYQKQQPRKKTGQQEPERHLVLMLKIPGCRRIEQERKPINTQDFPHKTPFGKGDLPHMKRNAGNDATHMNPLRQKSASGEGGGLTEIDTVKVPT